MVEDSRRRLVGGGQGHGSDRGLRPVRKYIDNDNLGKYSLGTLEGVMKGSRRVKGSNYHYWNRMRRKRKDRLTLRGNRRKFLCLLYPRPHERFSVFSLRFCII